MASSKIQYWLWPLALDSHEEKHFLSFHMTIFATRELDFDINISQ